MLYIHSVGRTEQSREIENPCRSPNLLFSQSSAYYGRIGAGVGDMRRTFHYTALQQSVWDAEILSLVAQICEHKGRQEFYLKDQTVALEC